MKANVLSMRNLTSYVLCAAFALIITAFLCGTTAVSAADNQDETIVWREVAPSALHEEVRAWVTENKHRKGIALLPARGQRYLLISWGSRPTGGYSLNVKNVVKKGDGKIYVQVQLQEPDPDLMVIQIITNPHRVIELPSGTETIVVQFTGASWFPVKTGNDNVAQAVLEAVQQEDGSVPNPLVAQGRVRIEDGTIQLRVSDEAGRILNSSTITLHDGKVDPDWYEFEAILVYDQPSSVRGSVSAWMQEAEYAPFTVLAEEPVNFSVASRRARDVDGHWAEGYIRQGIWSRFIDGYPDGSFRPESLVTRAEFLKLLVAAVGEKQLDDAGLDELVDEEGHQFKDLTSWSTHWVIPYLNKAIRLGWVVPNEEGDVFRPQDIITRQEMARWVARAAELEPVEGEEIGVADAEEIGAPYRSWVNATMEANVLEGFPDQTFRPEDGLKRAEAVTVVWRLTAVNTQ